MKIRTVGSSPLLEDIEAVLNALKENKQLILHTSGTTGTPKEVPIDLNSALARKRPGNPDERWLLTYDPKRWAGISVVLHAEKADCELCVPQSLSFGDLLEGARQLKPSHLGCTPSMLRNLVRHDAEETLRSLPIVQFTFGGEAATQSVLNLAKSIWPEARISHVYASTELGDICSVSDGNEGVPRHKFSEFEFGEGGELIVGGRSTGDFWELRDERYYFLGRKEEIINVGGNKVSPIALEEFALEQGAESARAYAVPSALMGSLVGLDYVGGPEEKSLSLAFRNAFPKYACPASLNRVQEIELSQAGKTKRLT